VDDKKQLKIFEEIILEHRTKIAEKIKERKQAMGRDDNSHYLLYKALGIEESEHAKIDIYQNIGRFVYKYAGAMLEKLAVAAIAASVGGESIRIQNMVSTNPKTFEIDCYTPSDNRAHEIKWRDATTDGDHIRKEKDKVKAILQKKMIPVRVMFYLPQRAQAKKIQEKIVALYREKGKAFIDSDAWSYIKEYTGYDLLAILKSQV